MLSLTILKILGRLYVFCLKCIPVKNLSPFFRVEYETFDILEDEEVSSGFSVSFCVYLQSQGLVEKTHFGIPVVSLGAAGIKNVLKLANLPSAVCERGACWRIGYC